MDFTLTDWPATVTANSLVAGAVKLPLPSTKFHAVTGAGSASLVVMRWSSRMVGEMMRRLFSSTIGRRVAAVSAAMLPGDVVVPPPEEVPPLDVPPEVEPPDVV